MFLLKAASDFSICFRWTDEDETKVDVFLQVLHHHLSPGEVTEGVGSIVRVGFSLTAPRPHAHFIQDVFQLYFTANIWRKRRREEALRMKKLPTTSNAASSPSDEDSAELDSFHKETAPFPRRQLFPHHMTSQPCRCDRRK